MVAPGRDYGWRTSLVRMADIFDVLSDEARRTILILLLNRPSSTAEMSVSQIVSETNMAQPAVSKQLKVLRDAGLVSVREDGQHRLYKLDSTPLREAGAWLSTFTGAQIQPASAHSRPTTPSVQHGTTVSPIVLKLARDLGSAAADWAGKAPWR
jgi:ArsR family transcriptional regulator